MTGGAIDQVFCFMAWIFSLSLLLSLLFSLRLNVWRLVNVAMVATSQHAESNSTSAQIQQVCSSKSTLTAFILLKASSLSSVAQALELKRKKHWIRWEKKKKETTFWLNVTSFSSLLPLRLYVSGQIKSSWIYLYSTIHNMHSGFTESHTVMSVIS